MKSLTKTAAVVLFLFITSLSAQPRFNPEDQLKELKEVLNLNEQQADSIKIVLGETRNAMRKLMESSGGDRMGRRDSMRKLLDDSSIGID